MTSFALKEVLKRFSRIKGGHEQWTHVDDIPETSTNMSMILEKLDIHNLYQKYEIISDLKLDNIIPGLTSCSSRHPCLFCKTWKDEQGFWIKSEPRTLENLLEDQEMWETNSGDKAALKYFNNVRFKSLVKTPAYKLLSNDLSPTKTISVLTPPGLHVILLGPVNYVWKHLGLVWDLTPFEQTHRLVKTDKQKRELQGPECHKLLRKLPELRDYLSEEPHTFVDILEEIKEVYTISHAKEVVPNHREVTEKFENTWCSLMTSYGLTMPVKVHIICEHFSEYIEETGKTLHKSSDQFVEAAHHKVKAFFEARSNYNHKEKLSPESGDHFSWGDSLQFHKYLK